MKIALTGGGGFLGHALLHALAAHPHISVFVFTSQSQALCAQFSSFPNITVLDHTEIDRFAFDRIDVLIHAAFPTSSDPEAIASGIAFTKALLESAVAAQVGAVINISSQSVYGQAKQTPAAEHTPPAPCGSYACGKYACEALTNDICRAIPHTNLRMASLISPDLDRRVVNQFVHQVCQGQPLRLIGGSQRFGYLDVRDAAAGIVQMLAYPANTWAEVYNLGQNGGYTLLEIAQAVQRIGAEQGYSASDTVIEPSKAYLNSTMDCTRFHTAFHWKPVHTLLDTIKDIYRKETEQSI